VLRTLLALGLPLVLGLPFTLALTSWPARLGMAFLSGVVIIAVGLTVVGTAGIRFGFISLTGPAVVWLAAAGVAVRLSPRIGWASLKPAGVGRVAWVLLGLTAVNVTTAAAYAYKTPISIYDVTVVWLPKANSIASAGFDALAHSSYPDYPPLWPLQLYMANGSGPWLKLVPAAYLIATLAVVFGYVRPRVGPAFAAACALAISGVPYIWLPYGVNDLMADVPTMAFVTASTIMLAEYVNHPSGARAAMTGLACVGVVWVRPEGFFHAFIVAAVLLAAGVRFRRVRETLLSAGAVVGSYVAWQLIVSFDFGYSKGLKPDLSALDPAVIVTDLNDIIRYGAANVGNPYLLGPALIAVAGIAFGISHWRSFGIVGTVLALDIAVSVATLAALSTTNVGEPLVWWLSTDFKRMVMHFIALLYVSAAIAIGAWWWQPRTAAAYPRGGAQSRGPGRVALALAAIALLVAGYASYRVGGPKAYDLSAMAPTHVSGSSVDFSTPGFMSVTTDGKVDPQIIFYLQNTGRRSPPVDNISGTFARFSSLVEAQGPTSVTETFMVSADGRPMAATTAVSGSGPVTISGQIPLGTRLLELTVRQTGTGTAIASWIQPTVFRASAWWAVDGFLLLALVMIVISATATLGVLKFDAHPWLGRASPALISTALLAAAALQQFEATSALLVPSWAYGVQLIAHV